MSNEVELVVYEHGERKVIGTATVSDDGKTVMADVTDTEWAKVLSPPIDASMFRHSRVKPIRKRK